MPYTIYRILKQADTIKELCDEFVVKVNVHNVVLHDLDSALRLAEDYGNHELTKDYEIYGAIWVIDSNGVPTLKLVAKMNDNGELCLL